MIELLERLPRPWRPCSVKSEKTRVRVAVPVGRVARSGSRETRDRESRPHIVIDGDDARCSVIGDICRVPV